VVIYGHGTDDPNNLINSCESFGAVREAGADGVELDVRVGTGGALVVIHDHEYPDGRLVATTNGTDRPDQVLLLERALDLCGGLIVNIEIKNFPQDPAFDPTEAIADKVVQLLASRETIGKADRVLISCFGIACLDRVLELRPGIQTAHLVLSRRPANQVIGPCVQHGHKIVHPYVSMIDESFMAVATANGLTVNAWTGFDEAPEVVAELAALGVQGVITGYPERAVQSRDR
jgi:glycerophosphoryl diester phosphodiesterase